MSLLSSKHVDVVLGSDSFEIILRSKGLGAKVILQRKKTFTPSNHINQSFIRQLTEALSQLHLRADTPLTVLLMSEHVHYTTLPAQSEPLSTSDQVAYAKATFEQLYGEVAQQWVVAVQETPPFHPQICAAIHQSLLDALKQVATQTKLALTTVSPFLNAVVDAFQKELRGVSCYLAVVEHSRLLLLQIQKGRPINLTIEMLERQAWDAMLMQMLARARFTATGDVKAFKQVLIHAPFIQLNRHQKLNSEHLKGWRIQWLENTKLYSLNHIAPIEAAA